MNRVSQIITKLTDICADLSGYTNEELPSIAPFLTLGFDSLFLTQLAGQFQKEYAIKITFRQLIETTPTITQLAEFIDDALPEDVQQPIIVPEKITEVPTQNAVPQATAQVTTVAAVSAPIEGLAGIFAEQLQLMQRQLEMLGAIPQSAVNEIVPLHNIQNTSVTEPEYNTANVLQPRLPKGFGPELNNQEQTLTAAQLQHLERLIARYNVKTKSSKQRTQTDRLHHADPRTASGFNPYWKEMVYPIVICKSFGAHLWDVDDNKYVDLLNGFGPNFFGHRAPFITDAIREQLDSSFEVGPQTPLAGEAAKLLCELTGMDRVSWVNTGSEAVQAAIRISRTVTGRDKIVLFSGDYHGNFDEVLVRGVHGVKGPRTYPLAPGIPQDSVSNVIVLDYGEQSALDYISKYAEEIACVLVEPIQSRRPEFQPKEFLHELRALTTKQEIILVFDEVITGFRTCPGGAQEYFGIEADIATYGKIIGGGMPIGVVAGRARFMDTFDGGHWQYGDDSKPTAGVTFFAGTFVRHPIAIAAAHASLKYIKSVGPSLQEGVSAKAYRIATELNAFFTEHNVDIFIAQFASQMFIRVNDPSPLATLFFYHLRDRGIHVLEGFPSYMTAAHTEEDVDKIINSAKESVLEMLQDGLFSSSVDPNVASSFPTTTSQQEMWATCQLSDEANCAYNESDTIRIDGKLDTRKFIGAVEASLNAQEAFSLTFSDDGMTQSVCRNKKIVVQGIDHTHFDEIEQANALQDLLDSEARLPFSLSDGPLVRAFLIKRSVDKYIFIIFAHHLAFDGYSADLLMQDISSRYENNQGLESLRPYKDYVEKINQYTQENNCQSYWSLLFSETVPDALSLPIDYAFPPERTYTAASSHAILNADIMHKCEQAAKQSGASLYTYLLAVYAITLSRLSQQDDVIIGIPMAGQSVYDLDTIGYCVNTLPLRLRPKAGIEFSEFLKTVHTALLDAMDNPHLDLMALMQEGKIERDAARPSLIQAVFNYSSYMQSAQFSNCKLKTEENKRQYMAFDLFLNLTSQNGELIVDWDYNNSVLAEDSVQMWIGYYKNILEQVTQNSTKTIDNLSLLNADESNSLIAKLGPKQKAFDNTRSPCAMIASIAQQQPDAIALTQGDVSLSYGEMQGLANQFSHWLQGKGVKPGDIIGVMMGRNLSVLPVILGIWQSGAAYLPLDPLYPADRLDYMISDSDASIVIADQHPKTALPAAEGRLFLWKDILQDLGDRPNDYAPSADLSVNSTAYILYTSGSTGKPKGVTNNHGPLANFLLGLSSCDGYREISSCLALTTFGFDISMIEIFYPLTIGAKIIMATTDEMLDGYEIAALIKRHNPSLMQGTPSTYRLLLDSDWAGNDSMIAISGGEPLTPDVASALLERTGALWNFYGPTEASVYCTCTHVTDANDITIGLPMPGVQLYVVDTSGAICPPNVVGELWIGGAGVCNGYWQQEKLTAEQFIQDPFSIEKNARVYRTGDAAKILPKGHVVLLGRQDSQVKLRGFRIELGEIETTMLQHEDIQAAAVVVRKDQSGEDILIAYAQYAPDQVRTASELRRWLRHSLPDYMIPQMVVEIEQMPLSGAGKVDRNKLPMPNSMASTPLEAIAPRDNVEQAIADIWCDMLAVKTVSVTDNFFELGGQSLQAAQMVARLKRSLGRKIAPRAVIFETLEQLAASSEVL